MKYYLLMFITFLCGLSYSQDTPQISKRDTLLEYGFAREDEYLLARDIIAENWGIVFKTVAGCTVSTQLEDSITKFNKITSRQIEEKFGKDWKRLFEEQVKNKYDEISAQERTFVRKRGTEIETTILTNTDSKTSLKVSKTGIQKKMAEKDSMDTSIYLTNLRDVRNDLLYRGFDNIFKIEIPFGGDSVYYELECLSCTVSKSTYKDTLEVDHFAILPLSNSPSHLLITENNNATIKFSFNTSRLPDPEIYLNGKTHHSPIHFSTQNEFKLTIKYPDNISLKTNFVIESWQMFWKDGNPREGLGNLIDVETISILQSLEAGKEITILCEVRGEDNVLRKKGASFIIDK